MRALRHLAAQGAVAALLVLLPALGGILAADPGPSPLAPSPLEPASTGGLVLVERALAKLTQHRRLLVVAAHPDDEDTAALALVARGLGGEAAYLSLSRGEGGQNLIGPELGTELGLLRTRELLAAREVDGARQYFTRAYDFGYTASLEETFERWPREALVEDAVRVVRRFRPQVIVSVFPADGRGGHGHHQAAGIVAHEVFERAGDAAAFPELAAEEGLVPWAPAALLRSTWFDREATTLETDLGRLDPLTGRSLHQLAMASRSRHRSQDMGRIEPLGPAEGRYAWVAGPGGPDSDDLFTGIDTRLEAIADLLPEGEARNRAAAELAAVRALAETARAELAPGRLGAAAPRLVEILGRLRAARDAAVEAAGGAPGAEEGEAPPSGAAAGLLEEKLEVARAALAAAAGVALDAWTEHATAIPGNALRVEARLWHAGGGMAAEPLAVEPVAVLVTGAVSWHVEPARTEGKVVSPPAGELPPGALAAWAVHATAPESAPATVPYFLERPPAGDLYDWSAASPETRGEPFGAPPLAVRFLLRIGGEEVRLDREVVERVADPALGEVRRPLRVVPRLEVAVEPALLVWSTAAGDGGAGARSREVRVSLRSNAPYPLAGRLRLEAPAGRPAGWPAPEPVDFEIAEPGGQAAARFLLPLPDELAPGRYALEAVAALGPGLEHRSAYPLIDYPHVRATPYRRPASLELAAADIRWPALDRVGFVAGASDRVPRALAAVGVPVEVLSGRELAERDLARYDAIVVGSRAYETDPALARASGRLLDYARAGGTVIVLYQQYLFFDGGFAPFPLEVARPHDRVADEAAPVAHLAPQHPALAVPNRIGPADWEGWVQERGLYFAHEWDEAYTPLLELPGDGEGLRGALLIADLGEGTWVYTGLSFFRQLPAGVTGAYRLFANLLALGSEGAR